MYVKRPYDKRWSLSIAKIISLLFFSAVVVSVSPMHGIGEEITEVSQYELQNQLPSACPDYDDKIEESCGISACFSTVIANNPTFQGVARDAYRQFNALNWPEGQGVGIPNYAEPVYAKYDAFPVWQSWPTLKQVLSGEVTGWNKPDNSIPESCSYIFDIKEDGLSLYDNLKNKYSEVPVGSKVEVLSDILNAKGQRLIDVNGNPAYYQVYMNKPAFDYVSRLPNILGDELDFPVGTNTGAGSEVNSKATATRGAILVKAAWRELQEREHSFYHKTFALLLSENANGKQQCALKVMGLTGMHIVNKNNAMKPSSAQKRNEWSWATYESVYNSPVFTSPKGFKKSDIAGIVNAPGGSVGWGYFDLTEEYVKEYCFEGDEWNTKNEMCPINKDRCGKAKCEKSILVAAWSENIEAKTYIEDCKNYGKNSVWKKYRIIGVQWRADIGVIRPKTLGNTVLEPFQAAPSCAGCHTDANENTYRDYVFIRKSSFSDKGIQ